MRLIDAQSKQVGVVSLSEALRLAQEEGLDLAEVSPSASPPVVRILDWGKYRYEQEKQATKSRKKQKTVEVKQIRLGLKTESHDIATKKRAAEKFLKNGHKVKINLRFKGREITHPELGRKVLQSFIDGLAEVATKEQDISLNGRELSIVMIRKKDAKD